MNEIIPPKVIDILPTTTFVPNPSGGSDKPTSAEPPLEEGTRPEVTEAKELAEADKEKVLEDAGVEKELEKEPEKEAKKDETPPWMKARISKEEGRRKAAEERARQLEEQNAKLVEIARQYIPQPGSQPAPQRENYDDQDKFIEDKATWIAEQKILKMEADRRQNEAMTKAQRMQQEYVAKLHEAEVNDPGIVDLGMGKDPTFVAYITDEMAGAIKTSEAPAKVLRYLDDHRDELQKIYSMPPARAAAELGKIEERLLAPKPANVSKAPKPINPLNGGGGMPKNKYDPGVTDDEYFAMVEKENAERLAAMQRR